MGLRCWGPRPAGGLDLCQSELCEARPVLLRKTGIPHHSPAHALFHSVYTDKWAHILYVQTLYTVHTHSHTIYRHAHMHTYSYTFAHTYVQTYSEHTHICTHTLIWSTHAVHLTYHFGGSVLTRLFKPCILATDCSQELWNTIEKAPIPYLKEHVKKNNCFKPTLLFQYGFINIFYQWHFHSFHLGWGFHSTYYLQKMYHFINSEMHLISCTMELHCHKVFFHVVFPVSSDTIHDWGRHQIAI